MFECGRLMSSAENKRNWKIARSFVANLDSRAPIEFKGILCNGIDHKKGYQRNRTVLHPIQQDSGWEKTIWPHVIGQTDPVDLNLANST